MDHPSAFIDLSEAELLPHGLLQRLKTKPDPFASLWMTRRKDEATWRRDMDIVIGRAG